MKFTIDEFRAWKNKSVTLRVPKLESPGIAGAWTVGGYNQWSLTPLIIRGTVYLFGQVKLSSINRTYPA